MSIAYALLSIAVVVFSLNKFSYVLLKRRILRQRRWDLNRRVKEEIEKAGLTIPFPQRSVHVVTGPATIDVAEAGA